MATHWRYEIVFMSPGSKGSTTMKNTYYEAASYEAAHAVATKVAADHLSRTKKIHPSSEVFIKSLKVEKV